MKFNQLKKWVGIFAVLVVGITLVGCGNNANDTDEIGSGEQLPPIRLVNGKIEIDGALQAFAEEYYERTGQRVIIESLGGGVDILAQILQDRAAGNMPDIFVTGHGDLNILGDIMLDMSDQPWVAATDYALINEEGNVVGAPYAVEGMGLIYNADILHQAGIDPATLTNVNALRDAFEMIYDQKDALGLQAVVSTAAESGSMWWVGQHIFNAYLTLGLERGDNTFVDMLHQGELDEVRLRQFADYLYMLYSFSDPTVLLTGTYDDQLALFATGGAAFLVQGNWVDPSLPEYGADFEMGILADAFLPTDCSDPRKLNQKGSTNRRSFLYGEI